MIRDLVCRGLIPASCMCDGLSWWRRAPYGTEKAPSINDAGQVHHSVTWVTVWSGSLHISRVTLVCREGGACDSLGLLFEGLSLGHSLASFGILWVLMPSGCVGSVVWKLAQLRQWPPLVTAKLHTVIAELLSGEHTAVTGKLSSIIRQNLKNCDIGGIIQDFDILL